MTKNQKNNSMHLYAESGERLYLTQSERQRFISVAHKQSPLKRTFCLMLAYTGCRISEACNLKKADIQFNEGFVSIRTLKRRSKSVIREVPIPSHFVSLLKQIHYSENSLCGEYLWSETGKPPPRIVAYRWIKSVMREAKIYGPMACPKGLRHSYGVHATLQRVQLHMLAKWMGHASMNTTAIYSTALGPEEREVATRMW